MLRAEGIDVEGLGEGVLAWMSTRAGGVSVGPYASLNLGLAVGDDPAAVAENRRRVAQTMGAEPVWLRQVHGVRCLRLQQRPTQDEVADAAVTAVPGLPIAIQVADCLPLLCAAVDAQGRALAVGGAHAGWRGLAAGVLEQTLAALRELAPQAAGLRAWIGPCIGPTAFEVGPEVLAGFGVPAEALPPSWRHTPRADGSVRWHADLPHLATQRLRAAGVQRLLVEGRCTLSDSALFSFRRDGARSGRMVACIVLR